MSYYNREDSEESHILRQSESDNDNTRENSIGNTYWVRPCNIRGTNLYRRLEEHSTSSSPDNEDIRHLRVYLRIKPNNSKQKVTGLYEINSENSLTTVENKNECKYRKTYNFTKVFSPLTEQVQVFDSAVKDNLLQFINHDKDFSLLTYGTSGSGKTYSLMGTDSQPGVIPRSLETLFSKINVSKHPCRKPKNGGLVNLTPGEAHSEISVIQSIVKNCPNNKISDMQHSFKSIPSLESYRRMSINLMGKIPAANLSSKNKEYEVWVSFAEIYNEQVYDLLRPDVGPNQIPQSLKVIVPSKKQSYIKDIRWVCVRSGTEAFAVLAFGKKRLRFAQTQINSHSSRSHCLFTMKLIRKVSDDCAIVNTFRLCDLAGSERAKKTGNEGARLKESRKINTSLHILEKCLAAIRNVQNGLQVLPPYRESKLTQLLQNALSGRESISMLVNINPEPLMFDETQHVLNFSALASQISVVVEPKHNTEIGLSRCFSEISQFVDSDCKNSTTYDDFKISNEIVHLRGQIEKLENEFKIKLHEREREVRLEVWRQFMDIKKDSDKNAQIHLENEIKLLVKKNEFEMDNMKDYYHTKLNDKDSQIKVLQEKLNEDVNKKNNLNKSNSLDSSQCLNNSLKNTDVHKECRKQIEELNENIDSYKKQINELTIELKSAKCEFNMRKSMAIVNDIVANEEQTEIKAHVKDLEKKIQEMLDEKMILDSKLITLKENELDLKNKLEELARKNYVLEEINKTQSESLEVAQSKIDDLELEISKLKSDKKNISLIVQDKSLLQDVDNESELDDEESIEQILEEDEDEDEKSSYLKKCFVRISNCNTTQMISAIQKMSIDEENTSDSSNIVKEDTKECFVRISDSTTTQIKSELQKLCIDKDNNLGYKIVEDDSFGVIPLEEISESNSDKENAESSKQLKVVIENVEAEEKDSKKVDENENGDKKPTLRNNENGKKKYTLRSVLQKNFEDDQSSVDSQDLQDKKDSFKTPFKPAEDNVDNENSTATMSSCRKLFSKRILDEDAADPKAVSARALFVDANDEAKKTGVTPPSVANPYACEKKTRTGRKKKK